MNRTRAWLVVSPVLAAGVLVAHTLAYRLTGTPTDAFHAYLGHVPQILLLVALAGLALGRAGSRLDAPRPAYFATIAVTTFAVQEHLERLVHTGSVPMLLSTPPFVLGVVLQIPVALAAWALARWLLAAVRESSLRRPTRRRFTARIASPAVAEVARCAARLPLGRGPPRLLPAD